MAVSSFTQLAGILASAALRVAAVACQKQNDIATPANTLAALPLAALDPADNPTSPAKVDLERVWELE